MKKETEELLRELATKLGTTVEHLYEVLTKQSKAKAIECLGHLLFDTLKVVGMTVLWFNCHYTAPQGTDLFTFDTLCLCVASIAAICLIYEWAKDVPRNTSDVYGYWTNPEYGAINDIMYWIGR